MSLEGKSADEIAALATLSESVMSNPKTRLAYQRLLKQANPNISVPELELEARAGAVIGEQNKKIDELTNTVSLSAAQTAANALFEALRDDRVVTNRADFGALVKYAAEKGFQTTEAGLRIAAQHRSAENEAAEPTPSTLSQRGVEMPVDKDLMSNPAQWAKRTAIQAMDDLIKHRKTGAALPG